MQLRVVQSTSFEERQTVPAENTWYKKSIREHATRASKRSGVDLHKTWKSFEGGLLKYQFRKIKCNADLKHKNRDATESRLHPLGITYLGGFGRNLGEILPTSLPELGASYTAQGPQKLSLREMTHL